MYDIPDLRSSQDRSNVLPKDFDPVIYKKFHNDLVHLTDKQACIHYLQYGMAEGREYRNLLVYFPDFDPAFYSNMHSDLKHLSIGQASDHFLVNGIQEGRLYKKNQESKYPDFINNKLSILGL